jgi:hypothetical protein
MTLRAALLAKLARVPFPRAFPVNCALIEVSRSAQFWQRVGFERSLALPPANLNTSACAAVPVRLPLWPGTGPSSVMA